MSHQIGGPGTWEPWCSDPDDDVHYFCRIPGTRAIHAAEGNVLPRSIGDRLCTRSGVATRRPHLGDYVHLCALCRDLAWLNQFHIDRPHAQPPVRCSPHDTIPNPDPATDPDHALSLTLGSAGWELGIACSSRRMPNRRLHLVRAMTAIQIRPIEGGRPMERFPGDTLCPNHWGQYRPPTPHETTTVATCAGCKDYATRYGLSQLPSAFPEVKR